MWKHSIIVGPTRFLLVLMLLHEGNSNHASQYHIYDTNNCTEDNQCYGSACRQLPITPPEMDPTKDLMSFLGYGMQKLDSYPYKSDAVLLFGSTASGKSTVAEIIAGNLSRLHAVCSSSCSFAIVDEEDRIGLPSTKSKTLIPELYLMSNSSGRTQAIYDFGGLDYSRTPTQDVAVNLLMHRVLSDIPAVKLLFVVVQTAVKVSNGFDAFDTAVTNVVRLVNSIQKYSKSLGMVITKVANYNNSGRYIVDATVIREIVEFLTAYKSYLEEEDDESDLTSKKLRFTNTLLKTTAGNYNKIWFVRRPLNCGKLIDEDVMIDAKKNITELISKLEYSEVNSTSDFQITLSEQTEQTISNFTNEIFRAVTSATNLVTNGLSDHFNLSLDRETTWFSIAREQRLEYLKETRTVIQGLMEKLPSKDSSISEYSRFVKSYVMSLEYPFPAQFENLFRKQNEYNIFVSKVTGKHIIPIEQWTNGFKIFCSQLSNFVDWHDFALRLQNETFSYTFYSKDLVPPSNPNLNKWLDFINKNTNIQVTQHIRDISTQVSKVEQDWIEEILSYVLNDDATTSCVSGTGVISLSKNFITLSDVMHGLNSHRSCPNATQINLNVGHSIYITEDVRIPGHDLVLLSPNIIQPQGRIGKLHVAGFTGVAYPQAASGQNGTGLAGADGTAGRPGQPSGSFFGIFTKGLLPSKLEVHLVSGNGSVGQDGGHGGSGTSRDASWSNDNPDAGPDCRFQEGGHPIICYIYHNGISGGNGGSGGKGSSGCPSSKLWGSATLIGFNTTTTLSVTKTYGVDGSNGQPGRGGAGGVAGKGYECTVNLNGNYEGCFAKQACCGRQAGSNGAAGTGSRSSTCEEPKPVRELSVWQQLILYRTSHYQNLNPDTTQFLDFVDTSPKTKHFWTLKTLSQESVALELIDRHTAPNDLLASLYFSLVRRLEQFHTENYQSLSKEHQKVLSILLSTSYSTLISLDGPRGYGIIVDVTAYFNIVKQTIQQLKTISALEGIKAEKTKFQGDLQIKIDQCMGFIDNVVNPALRAAESEMEELRDVVSNQLRELVLDARTSRDKLAEQLRIENQKLRFLEGMTAFATMAGILESLIPDAPGAFGAVADQLKDEYSNQQEIVEKLDELKEAAEKLVAELEAQRLYFIQEFAPLVDPLLQYFRNVSDQLRNGTDISSPQLAVTKWQLKEKLTECKNKLEPLKDASSSSMSLYDAFDRIMDSMTMSIDLYEMIEQYIETQNLAGYIANVNSAVLDPIPITDPEYKPIVAEYEKLVTLNMLGLEVKRATFAFKQWVFPFAKLYLPAGKASSNALAKYDGDDDHLGQVELLLQDLERYKATTVGGQDTYIIQTNFSSGIVTSKPFYTWNNKDHYNVIEALMNGQKVDVLADVRRYGMTGREAIKFKLIEINFRLENVNRTEQQKFDQLLIYFGVSMTHTGVSSYRFLDKFYQMNGVNQTIRYNFERDINGNRLGTNIIYQKFKDGDLMLSPYTHWKIQLSIQHPNRKSLRLDGRKVDFSDLREFAKFAHLELVGIGTYVDGAEALAAAGGDLKLDSYYDRDTRANIRFEL